MATEDARYRQSTQYRLWSFSPAQLHEMREKTNALARSNISDCLSSRASTQGPSSSNTAKPSTSSTSTFPQPSSGSPALAGTDLDLPEFLAVGEELQLLNFYVIELLRAAAFCELPTDIRATAAIFLRRFYVTNSIMTYPPTQLLKTCLFFGAKAEGYYTRLSKFADNFPNTSPEEILAGEFLLCQGIRFAFDIRHPFRALEGAIMELRRDRSLDEKRLNAAHSRAREILKFSPLVTDAYFHFTPSQIMLAALSLADRALMERLLQEIFQHGSPPEERVAEKPSQSGDLARERTDNPKGTPTSNTGAAASKAGIMGAEIRAKVLDAVDACKEMLAMEPPERMTEFWGNPESNKIVKPLIKKLKKCRDPDRWDLVALQKARREQITRKASDGTITNGAATSLDDDGAVFGNVSSDRRDAKRRKVSTAADDPFGGPL